MIINPVYPGRKPQTKLWDDECTKTINLEYDNGDSLIPIREHTHSVGYEQFCLITINNFSLKNQKLILHENQNADQLKLFKLDNTDEIWWKTLLNL